MDKEELKEAYKLEYEVMQEFTAKNASTLEKIVEDSGGLLKAYEEKIEKEKKQLGI